MVFRDSCGCVCIRHVGLQTENILDPLCEFDGDASNFNINVIALEKPPVSIFRLHSFCIKAMKDLFEIYRTKEGISVIYLGGQSCMKIHWPGEPLVSFKGRSIQ